MSRVDQGYIDYLRENGAPESELAKLENKNADCEIWADCWDAVGFFIDCDLLWKNIVTMERVIRNGLDRVQVECEMRLRGWKKKKREAMWADMRVMERAAMQVINEKAK